MPKQVVTKESILSAALDMARIEGYETINARSLAQRMDRSVQPIYSYFANMDELKSALYVKAMDFYQAFIYARVGIERMLESMSMANVAFAKEEPKLFRLLFLTKLDGLNSFSAVYDWMGDEEAAAELARRRRVSQEKAREVYMMLIVFTHGIATMTATGGATLTDEEIETMLNKALDAFVGLNA